MSNQINECQKPPQAEDNQAALAFAKGKSGAVNRLDSDSDGDDKPSLFSIVAEEAKDKEAKPSGLLGGGMVLMKRKKKDKSEKKAKKDKKDKKDKKQKTGPTEA